MPNNNFSHWEIIFVYMKGKQKSIANGTFINKR